MHVLKIGGNELDNPAFLAELGQTVKALWQNGETVSIVHGGGKAISDLQARLGLTAVKIDGVRVTDAASLAVAQMVLSGQANKLIVQALLAADVDAVGLSGVDGGLLRCTPKQHPTADLGLVGEISQVRTDLLHLLAAKKITAVLSPISLGEDGQIYNVNADEAACAVALAMEARTVSFVSNVPGVLQEGQVIPALTVSQTEQLIANGTIYEGMVPKVQSALTAVSQGIPQARIVNLAGLSQGTGTSFRQ